MDIEKDIKSDKLHSIKKLKDGLAEECADDLTEVLINMEGGTCDYTELIPLLEEVARVEWFYYFDDNGSGGLPHADMSRKSSFKNWALTAIENIKENAKLGSSTMTASALKSNNTALIESTLKTLKHEGTMADTMLIPILEKIARKDAYKSYSYLSGFETDCHLGELARAVIQRIIMNSEAKKFTNQDHHGVCPVCGSLPDDITVNTGRGINLPDAFHMLVGMNSEFHPSIFRCPGCLTYYKWFEIQEYYVPGKNDEERLVRMSPEVSRLLDKLFSSGPDFRPAPSEVKEYSERLSPDLFLDVLHFRMRVTPDVRVVFLPGLLILLKKTNDTSLWNFLNDLVVSDRKFAQELLDTFSSSEEPTFDHTIEILRQCLRVLKKE
jgi:hypothetical protein